MKTYASKHVKRYYTSLLSCSNSLLELSFSSIFILAISLSFILASWNDMHQNFLSFFLIKNKSTYICTNICLVIIEGYFRNSIIRNSMENICLQIVLEIKVITLDTGPFWFSMIHFITETVRAMSILFKINKLDISLRNLKKKTSKSDCHLMILNNLPPFWDLSYISLLTVFGMTLTDLQLPQHSF